MSTVYNHTYMSLIHTCPSVYGTTTYRSYNYLVRAAIEPVGRSAESRYVTALTMLFLRPVFKITLFIFALLNIIHIMYTKLIKETKYNRYINDPLKSSDERISASNEDR